MDTKVELEIMQEMRNERMMGVLGGVRDVGVERKMERGAGAIGDERGIGKCKKWEMKG